MSDKKKNSTPIVALDPVVLKEFKKAEEAEAKGDSEKERDGVLDLILKSIKSHEQTQRMAFEVNPDQTNSSYAGMYRMKSGLTPDHIIKRLTGPQGDDLICAILQARSNHIASFGRPRSSRFNIGFEFEELADTKIPEDDDRYQQVKKKLDNLKEVLWNCGHKGLDDEYFHPNLSQCLKMLTRDGLAYGRFAVEFIKDPKSGKLHSFRPVDAGTIYRVVPRQEQDQTARKEALRLLAEIKNEKFDANKYQQDEYKWVQVINGKIVQAFSENELVVYNLYPVTNVEYNGYPLTPIDQALNAITTHINITLHNKLYFQHGRASRGMLIFKSDDLDESTVQKIRLQFHQSINSVQNSWRMPVFGVGAQDDLTWQSIDVTGRDMEFQLLMDTNARVVLSAFQMSPEELPGYAHLARGTNTQALAEADNEWKLTAARDVGLRPLLYDIQDFLNACVLPRFDDELSRQYQIVLSGLDHDSPEKEATRLSQDMGIHMTYNEILERVEKEKIGKEIGGDFPLNPQLGQVIDKYLTVGEILENFFGRKDAASDPRYNFYNNPLWLQWQQVVMNKAQMAMQSQMAAQQQQQEGGEPPPDEEVAPADASEEKKAEITANNLRKREEWSAKNFMLLQKTFKNNHDEISKMIIKRHKEIVKKNLDKWEKDAKAAKNKILYALKDSKEE